MAEMLTSKLNKLPEGLLDFFALKSMGSYPQSFSPQVAGTMDLTRWYADNMSQSARANLTAIGAPLAVGTIQITSAQWIAGGNYDLADGNAQTRVPQTEVWLIMEAAIHWNLGTDAAATNDMALAVTSSVGGGDFIILTDQLQGYTTNAATQRGGARVMVRDQPFLMLPGTVLCVRNFGAIPGANSILQSVTVRVKRLLR